MENRGLLSRKNNKNRFKGEVYKVSVLSRVIIEKPELTERYMQRTIFDRLKSGININEIWLLNKNGDISLLYKKTDG